MSGPIPSPMQAYAALPYQFPLIDLQPVVRIPVAGPAPFNTLAVVRTVASIVTSHEWANGEINRQQLRIPTALILAGFDPQRPEQQRVVHSSTATIRMMQISREVGIFTDDNTDFIIAVDAVESESTIDVAGHWSVTVNVANAFLQVFAAATVEISSYVLCWEPPL